MLNTATRVWVERALGATARLTGAKPLLGGVSSTIHEVRLEGATLDGVPLVRAIVRQITEVRDDPTEGPWEIVNEARILQHCDGRAKAPRWIASDPTGEHCGFPTSLQTRLPGRPMVKPKDRGAWAIELSRATNAIASFPSRSVLGLTPYRPWWPSSPEPPEWTRSKAQWVEMSDALHAELPEHSGTALIHRDLHPANVLFWRGKWSGTVDWTHGCLGPPEVDIARCRVQIAFLTDMHTADLYLDRCRDLVATYDPRWDALVALELSPWVSDIAETYQDIGTETTTEQIATTLDRFVVG